MLKHLCKEVPEEANVWSKIWNGKSGIKIKKGEKKHGEVMNDLL